IGCGEFATTYFQDESTMKAKKPKKSKRPGIPCPHCEGDLSEVVRTVARGPALQRVRRCLTCKKSFTTREATAKSDTGVMDLATGVSSSLKALESTPSYHPSLAKMIERKTP